MIAFGVVMTAIAALLALIYGVGWLCFLWWDGGAVRKIVLLGGAAVVVDAVYRFAEEHWVRFY